MIEPPTAERVACDCCKDGFFPFCPCRCHRASEQESSNERSIREQSALELMETHAKALEAEVERLTGERNGLAIGYEARGKEVERLTALLARDKTNAAHRLHNICDALHEQAGESPFSREAWEQADAAIATANREIERLTLAEANAMRAYRAKADEAERLRAALERIRNFSSETTWAEGLALQRLANEALERPADEPALPVGPCDCMFAYDYDVHEPGCALRATPETSAAHPPVDNDHVAPGCEKFDE
jgi:hypothetical protein